MASSSPAVAAAGVDPISIFMKALELLDFDAKAIFQVQQVDSSRNADFLNNHRTGEAVTERHPMRCICPSPRLAFGSCATLKCNTTTATTSTTSTTTTTTATTTGRGGDLCLVLPYLCLFCALSVSFCSFVSCPKEFLPCPSLGNLCLFFGVCVFFGVICVFFCSLFPFNYLCFLYSVL